MTENKPRVSQSALSIPEHQLDDIEIASSNQKRRLKEAEYHDFRGRKGKVVYEKRGRQIIFSAITRGGEVASTVNAAERVVIAISEAEGINWRDPEFGDKFEFYDLSTPIGYPHRSKLKHLFADVGEVQIDRLIIRSSGNKIEVVFWEPVRYLADKKALLDTPAELKSS